MGNFVVGSGLRDFGSFRCQCFAVDILWGFLLEGREGAEETTASGGWFPGILVACYSASGLLAGRNDALPHGLSYKFVSRMNVIDLDMNK